MTSAAAASCPSCSHERDAHGIGESCIGGRNFCRCTVTRNMLDFVQRRRHEIVAAARPRKVLRLARAARRRASQEAAGPVLEEGLDALARGIRAG